MEERYTRLYKLESNLYVTNAPIIIEEGALLKDNNENKLIVQLKILNISYEIVTAVKLHIKGSDAFGNKGDIQEFQYLDISVSRNQEFGQQTAIVLKNDSIRQFEVDIIEVAFSDNSKWINENENSAIHLKVEPLSSLLKETGMLQQYRIENGKQCNTIPKEFNNLWICSCGSYNHQSEITCNSCKKDKTEVFLPIDIENLKARRKDYINAEKYSLAMEALNTSSIEELTKAKEIFQSLENYKEASIKTIECDNKIKEITEITEKKAADERSKKKKLRILEVSFFSVVGSIVLIFVIINVIIPYSKYSKAQSYLNSAKYDEATKLFTELGNYKNSKEMISEVQLQRGVALIENHKFDEADEVLSEILEYKNAEDYLSVSKYAKWYENSFDPANEDVFYQLKSKVEGLLAAKSKIGEAYSNAIFEYIYKRCEKMNALKEFSDSIDFLIKMNYKVNDCNKLLENYTNMFSGYDGLYEESGNSIYAHYMIITTDLKKGKVTFQYCDSVLNEKYEFELNTEHYYRDDTEAYIDSIRIFDVGNNKVTYKWVFQGETVIGPEVLIKST